MRGRKETPRGMPQAVPRILRGDDGEGGKNPEFVYPHEILNVRSKDALVEALDHYAHPAPWVEGASQFNARGKDTMKFHTEWTLPTLRWYCRVYAVEIPDWLKGNHWVDMLSDKEKKKHLGLKGEHKRVEWREDKRFSGVKG